MRCAAGGAAAIVLLFGGFLLAGPVAMFGFAWPVRDGSLVHLLLPDAETFGWPLRLAQGVLSVGAGVAVALVLRHRRDALWLAPFAVCVVRLLIDPVLAGYYFAAPAVLCLIGLALATASRTPLRMLAAFVLFTLTIGLAPTGWVGPAVLVLAATALVVLVARGREPAVA